MQKISLKRVLRAWIRCFALLFVVFGSMGSVVIDQVLATVGSSAITLRDVRVHSLLESLTQPRLTTSDPFFLSTASAIKQARSSLLARVVILNYLHMSGLPLSVPDERQEEMKKTVFGHFGTSQEADNFFKGLGIEPSEIDRWIVEKLRAETFVHDQMALRVQISDQDVQSHYEQRKTSRYLDQSWDNIRNVVRADLFRERLKVELEKWLDIEMERVGVMLLPVRVGSSRP